LDEDDGDTDNDNDNQRDGRMTSASASANVGSQANRHRLVSYASSGASELEDMIEVAESNWPGLNLLRQPDATALTEAAEKDAASEDSAAYTSLPSRRPCPYSTANWLSMLAWSWLGPLLSIGAKRTLDDSDLFELMERDRATLLHQRMKEAMEKAKAKQMEREMKKWEKEKKKTSLKPRDHVNSQDETAVEMLPMPGSTAAAAAAAAAASASPSPASSAHSSSPLVRSCTSSPTSAIAAPPTRPSLNLWLALWYLHGPYFLKSQLLFFLFSGCKIVQPLMLAQLVNWLSEPEDDSWKGFVYAVALGLGALGQAFLHHIIFWHTLRVGVDTRIALNAIIFDKALELRSAHLLRTTTGQIVNLVSNDSGKCDDAGVFMSYLWSSPFDCIIVLIILYYQIGVAAFAGFGAMFMMTPLQTFFSRLFARYRRLTLVETDARIKCVNEILVGADVVKMMTWEEPLEEKVQAIRRKEFKNIRAAATLKSINQAIFFSSSCVVSLVTFGTMYLLGQPLNPAAVFSTISLFNIIRLPLTNFLPLGVERLAEVRIAFNRIGSFLELDADVSRGQDDEYRTKLARAKQLNDDLEKQANANPHAFQPGSITMRQASFVWETPEQSENSSSNKDTTIDINDNAQPTTPTHANATRQGLRQLNLRIEPGQLVGAIGPIGAYKSSFLAACLGEMNQLSGGMLVRGRLAYASQNAWIFADTIRANIIFGRPWDPKRYVRTIAACQLMDDIRMQPAGDQTMIGEKGVNLSGGQRARVGMARAVYGDADIYLFDDVLAALDTIVARKLFEMVIGPNGLLRNRTRVLVTHQTHLLTAASQILMLEDGSLRASGTFNELIDQGLLNESHRHAQADSDSAAADAAKQQRREAREERRRAKAARMASNDQTANAVGTDASRKPMELDAKQISSQPPNGTTGTSTAVAAAAAQDTNSILRAESSQVGGLDAKVFIRLFQAGGGIIIAYIILILILVGQAAAIACDAWLAQWSAKSDESQRDETNAYVYLGLVVGTVIIAVVRAEAAFNFVLRASSALHGRMLHAVLYSPLRFFESNPVGRVLNRFAKDQSIMDDLLPFSAFDMLQCFAMVVGSVAVVAMNAPYVMLVLIATIPFFIFVRRRFLATSRELKRLDATTRSPVYALFSSTLAGLSTIRAFRSQQALTKNFLQKMDDNSRPFLIYQMTTRWLSFRLDAISVVIVTTTCLVIAGTRGSIDPAAAGFTLSYVLTLTALLHWAVRRSSEVETMLTSVERIVEYTDLPPEGDRIRPDCRPPSGWPSRGVLEFNDYKMRYRSGLDLVLKGVNVRIESSEKVGVVGRTGAGKSSLFQAILRLVEADSGGIIIDDIETSKLGLQDLRSHLAVIPQSPTILSGTVRYNLDPFHQHSDASIWSALDACQLRGLVHSLGGLDGELAELGSNLSVGECQLICVARALLRPSKVLLVDEATANVDARTDALIQRVLRDKFADRTVIVIAHRLQTILDMDKIIVMSAGRVAEVGSPAELLSRPAADPTKDPDATYGLFSFMANQKKKVAS